MRLTKIELIFLSISLVIILVTSIFFVFAVSKFKTYSEGLNNDNISLNTNNNYINNNLKYYRILFSGDLMMGRGLDKYFNQYGYDYPFLKIQSLLKDIDWNIVYGNLEGPIINNAPPIKSFSFTFGFVPEVASALKRNGFNLLNISNNHITNYGYQGVISTRKYLRENDIEPLGDNYECNLKYSITKDNFIFFGINLVPPNEDCVQELINTIKNLKENNKNYFIIVTPHWGNEYKKLPNDFQKEVAHQLIDSGVDLIIGHHPHVIEGIELYHQKLIFYSLGNLVFDQYFSKDTQESLLIGFQYTPLTQEYYLFPLKSVWSQLNYLDADEEQKFLENLANISSPELKEMILNGRIIIE